MAKLKYQHHHRILTANDLRSGAVLFWSHCGWQHDPAQAVLAQDEQQSQALLTIAQQAEAENSVVGSYLVAVENGTAGRQAVELREQVRLSGPPILNDAPAYREAA